MRKRCQKNYKVMNYTLPSLGSHFRINTIFIPDREAKIYSRWSELKVQKARIKRTILPDSLNR